MREATAGDPMGELRWTHKSTRKIWRALRRRGYRVGRSVVRRLLQARRYSLRINQKRLAGPPTRQRDQQFHSIRRQQQTFLPQHWPVISVDTKKKELIGNFQNAGRVWTRRPRVVNEHDFPSLAAGKAIPYGIYDVGRNRGYVVVGVSHETAAFAVAALRSWWLAVGQHAYPGAARLLIQADCGGANGNTSRLWKVRLQELADECGLRITVTHYPAGASKWNAIEHRMCSLISQHWAGQPLVSSETLLKHIRSTRADTGFHCRARLDCRGYATGVQISPEEAASLRVRYHKTFPQWNYTISPHPSALHNK